jgi:hypothetical protein
MSEANHPSEAVCILHMHGDFDRPVFQVQSSNMPKP